LTGYEAFCLYSSLKLHFTSSYDYFKYGGKLKVTIDSFDNRKDKYYFHKISRKFNKDDYIEFLVSNFLHEPNIWIGKLMDEEANERYLNYQKVNQSLSYIFENECTELFNSVEKPNELFKTSGEHPILLKKVMRNEISIQTFFILNKFIDFVPAWKQKISDTIVWPNFQSKIENYSGFLRFDETKFRLILKKCLT
jgi:hypothetical protein